MIVACFVFSRFAPCSNYTWASRNYMTDQIIISRDSPCTAVMPGTMIGPDCDPAKAYNPASGESLSYLLLEHSFIPLLY